MRANMERFRLSMHAEKALLAGSNYGRRDDVCVHIPSSQLPGVVMRMHSTRISQTLAPTHQDQVALHVTDFISISRDR